MARVLLPKLILLSLLVYSAKCDDPEQCIQNEDHCGCRFQDGRKIDISKLFANGKDSSESRFLEADKQNFRFFFHGCSDAKFKVSDYGIPSTVNATVPGSLIVYQSWLVNNTVHENLTTIGFKNQIQFTVLATSQEPYQLIYVNKSDEKIIASFRLICEQYEKPYIQIIDDPAARQFTLNSPYACLVKEPEGSSFGTKFLIFLLLVCMIYFVGGACVLYFARGARGLELIPNIDFWKKLPGLVRDGTLFLFGGCNANYVSSADVYDRI